MSASKSLIQSSPVLYAMSMEKLEDDESKTGKNINELMAKIRETTFNNSGAAIRSVHAKSHGLLTGKLTIASDLPAILTQGLFSEAAEYPVMIRFSTTPGDILDDSVSTPRGMAIKVVGVKGPRVDGSESDVTQDFVLVNGPAFNRPNAKGFLADVKLLEPTTDKMQAFKKVASAVLRGTEAAVEAFGGKSPTLNALGGQPETNILGETFYSQVPVLFGPYIAKIGVFPVSAALKALTKAPLDLTGKPNGIRDAVVEFFLKNGGSWEVRAQLCINLETMPIEDASVVWPEDESPYVTVATITVPSQDPWTVEKIAAIDAGLLFSPWHALAAHRPLGSVMRVRKTAYEQSAAFRAEHNHNPIVEPRSDADLPF